jgi:N-acetyl-gamma-glutamyl-phosphate reductase
MKKSITVAVLGSTGYVGLELINILSKHLNVEIVFLGSENYPDKDIKEFDTRLINNTLPKLDLYKNINLTNIDVVFLALPHVTSHNFVKENINKTKIIDLSADFRLNDSEIYRKNYNSEHSCPNLLKNFVYGLPEINYELIRNSNNISVPGCYPTSVLLPLIPLIQENLIRSDNIIIDSKSGYSGAGKKFDKKNISKKGMLNFYNYNTNQHRHICEIHQELSKISDTNIKFSFNPHILPIFRGMMSTIYCDLNKNISSHNINECVEKFSSNTKFVRLIDNAERNDFFKVQNTNNCFIKLFNHYDSSKIIIVSLIDNLLKGASGQAVQCMNIMFGCDEKLGLENIKSD